MIHSRIHSIIRQKYSFKEFIHSKKHANYSFKEFIHSKKSKIIHSKNLFIQIGKSYSKLEVKYVKVKYEKLSWKSPDLVKAHLNKAHLKNDLKDDSTFKQKSFP